MVHSYSVISQFLKISKDAFLTQVISMLYFLVYTFILNSLLIHKVLSKIATDDSLNPGNDYL